MKRLFIPHICSVFLLGALTLGSLDATHAASHNEAPMIDFDNKADYSHTGLDEDTDYIYRVEPINPPSTNEGSSQASVGFQAGDLINMVVGGAEGISDNSDPLSGAGSTPSPNSALGRQTSVDLSWSTGNVGYSIYPTQEPSGLYSDIGLDSDTDSSYSHTGLAEDTYYVYRVEAINAPSANEGNSEASVGFQAGDLINMVVEGAEGISDSQASMTLTSADSGETVEVSGTLNEDVGAGIWGNRKMANFTLPQDLSPAFYDLSLIVGLESTESILVEVAESTSLNRRRELVQIIQTAINNKYSYPYALVGPYRHLPMGSQIKDSITAEVVATIDQDNMWLFFAYDPAAFLGQPDARWILINGNSEEMQIIENREFEPEVTLVNGEPYPLDYGSHDHVYYGLFATGPYLQDRTTGSSTTPENRDGASTTPEITLSTQAPIIGLSFSSEEPCPPEKVKKYAFVVTLDDTDKRFEALKNQEKNLLKKLGIPTGNLHELNPADFVTTGNTFEIDEKTWDKSFKKLREKIEAVLKQIDDCCAEVLFIVNSHGNSDGRLIFKKAQKDADWKKVKKVKETLEVKPQDKTIKKVGKMGKGGKGKFASGLLAKMIAETFQKMDKTCIPVAFINHSCYSGKISSSDQNRKAYDAAIKAHSNLRIYSSSSVTERTYAQLKGGAYSFPFLEAIDNCLLKSAGKGKKTLEDQWKCIVKQTKDLANLLKKKQTPSKYPTK